MLGARWELIKKDWVLRTTTSRKPRDLGRRRNKNVYRLSKRENEGGLQSLTRFLLEWQKTDRSSQFAARVKPRSGHSPEGNAMVKRPGWRWIRRGQLQCFEGLWVMGYEL